MKRLCDVIIRAGIESLDLVAPAISRGEDQDRHHPLIAAPGFQYRNAIHLRQADVEDDCIVGLAVAEEMPFLTVEGAIDDISGIAQRSGALTVEIRIVLNDKQAHVCLPR